MAAADPGMLASLFLASSRSLAARSHRETYAPIVLRYKGECIRMLNKAIDSEGQYVLAQKR